MTLSIISFTKNGYELSLKLNNKIKEKNSAYNIRLYYKSETIKSETVKNEILSALEDKPEYVKEGLEQWVKAQFADNNALIFIGAVGIAVRSIAKCVDNKLSDSPVIVIDEKGDFVIPILSGHVGGANEIALMLAELLDAYPVITTATDKNNVWAADVFAKKNKLNILNKDRIKAVNAKSLEGKKIRLVLPGKIEPDFKIDENIFDIIKKDILTESDEADIVDEADIADEADVIVLNRSGKNIDSILNDIEKKYNNIPLILSPKEYIIGIGCKKNKTCFEIEKAIMDSLDNNNLSVNSIAYLVSIDLKKDEQGILDFADRNRIEFVTFSSEELESVDGTFEESEFVKEKTGVGNVCERASIKACTYGGSLIRKKTVYDGITIAIAKRNWIPEIKI